MAGKYQAYPEYKEVKYFFLQSIPSHWVIKPLYMLCDFRQGKAHEPYIDDDGDYICVNSRFISTGGKKLKRCGRNLTPANHDDVLMVMSDLPNGRALAKAFHVKDHRDYAVNQRVCALTAHSVNSRFLYYQLDRSPYFLMYDDGSNQTHLTNSVYKKAPVFLPPNEEQQKIADFLDYEIAQIDTLIDKQQQLIQLLKEKRQAVISHAVTKGLNPDAPMKDSGIEWLGEVPEHWESTEIRYITKQMGGGTPNKDRSEFWQGDIPWISPKDMKVDYISDAQDKITNQAVKESSTKLIPAGSVLIVVRGMILAHSVPVAITTREVTINQDMKALLPVENIDGEFLLLFMKGLKDYILDLVEESAHGTKCLRSEEFERIKIIIPRLDEQVFIVEKVKEKINMFDSLIENANYGVELLQERRSALISAAVTGKIDVRGWQPPAKSQPC